MMNYESFKELVTKKFMDYMPDEMQGMKLRVNCVRKVNVTLDSVTIDSQNPGVKPTFYINDMYEEYKNTNDFDEVLKRTALRMVEAMDHIPFAVPKFCSENAKDRIVFQVINNEQNREMLSEVPHREFQDLSIIYRWVVNVAQGEVASTLITTTLAQQIGMDEEQLYRVAMDNTRRIFPPVVKSINDMMRDMFVMEGMSEEAADMMISEIPDDTNMWIITNEQNTNGASSILYEDILHTLAEKLETDLYIMPSSIHEVIAVPTNMGDPNMLAQMVHEINMGQVALKERLSNQVYHYDKELRKLTLATDTPDKRLDSIAV